MEPELVCIDGSGKSAGLGVIGRDGGMLLQVPINLVQKQVLVLHYSSIDYFPKMRFCLFNRRQIV